MNEYIRMTNAYSDVLYLYEAVGQVARFLFQEVYPLTEEPILGPEALK